MSYTGRLTRDDFIAELTAAMRPDWTCTWRIGEDRCEGRVTHHVHLRCEERGHKGMGTICAGHLRQIMDGEAYDTRPLAPWPGVQCGLPPQRCNSVLRVVLMVPIENLTNGMIKLY